MKVKMKMMILGDVVLSVDVKDVYEFGVEFGCG